VPLPDAYLSVWGLPELQGIRRTAERLEVGALTTYHELIQSAEVRGLYPALAEASRWVGAAQIQNRGTIGGNVVNGSPAGDTLPVLAVAGAELVVESLARGRRRVPFGSFYTGYRKTALAFDELLVRIDLPIPPEDSRGAFAKVGSRRAQTISKVMAAIQARCDDQGRMLEVALAYGAVAPVVLRLPETEAALTGKRPSPELADNVASVLGREIAPIDDVRSSVDYRRFLAVGLLRRMLRGWA